MTRTLSICPAIPDIITRSCSVGYLDNVELPLGEVTLSQLRSEAPKRLVLVDKKIQTNRKYRRMAGGRVEICRNVQQLRHRNFKKSISLDFCDALQDIPNLHKDLNNLFNQMPKLAESSENQSEDTEYSSTELSTLAIASTKKNKLTSTPKKSPKEKFCSFFSSRSGTPILGRKFRKDPPCSCPTVPCLKCSGNKNDENKKPESSPPPLTTKPPLIPRWSKKQDKQQSSENGENSKTHKRHRNLEIITSFTDSPLFSRKYRAAKNELASTSCGNQSERNTPILARRSENRSSSSDSGNGGIEILPVEAKASVSLHTQVSLDLNF
jgi:tubby-related protein 4